MSAPQRLGQEAQWGFSFGRHQNKAQENSHRISSPHAQREYQLTLTLNFPVPRNICQPEPCSFYHLSAGLAHVGLSCSFQAFSLLPVTASPQCTCTSSDTVCKSEDGTPGKLVQAQSWPLWPSWESRLEPWQSPGATLDRRRPAGEWRCQKFRLLQRWRRQCQ